MKRFSAALLLVAMALLLSAPTADACQYVCGITYDVDLYGGAWALCLVIPEENGYVLCREWNIALGPHACELALLCRNGYVIP
jgi:hypothetical protein